MLKNPACSMDCTFGVDKCFGGAHDNCDEGQGEGHLQTVCTRADLLWAVRTSFFKAWHSTLQDRRINVAVRRKIAWPCSQPCRPASIQMRNSKEMLGAQRSICAHGWKLHHQGADKTRANPLGTQASEDNMRASLRVQLGTAVPTLSRRICLASQIDTDSMSKFLVSLLHLPLYWLAISVANCLANQAVFPLRCRKPREPPRPPQPNCGQASVDRLAVVVGTTLAENMRRRSQRIRFHTSDSFSIYGFVYTSCHRGPATRFYFDNCQMSTARPCPRGMPNTLFQS